eukprot:CAMPEP_0117615338 /NCGR_PEP_ID=MMETSP0784-20121206/84490_1 /TAXON_ID=39447 /ORGANISM="" /LENGTH=121 /DNA_ID=CAMNT_0005419075 /DNA_START=67 /DNA_END=430 /DNA_ORIENTATION=+
MPSGNARSRVHVLLVFLISVVTADHASRLTRRQGMEADFAWQRIVGSRSKWASAMQGSFLHTATSGAFIVDVDTTAPVVQSAPAADNVGGDAAGDKGGGAMSTIKSIVLFPFSLAWSVLSL